MLDLFERIKLLMKYKAIPYIMRFNRYEESPYRGTYINMARWCNQPNFFKKMSYYEYCMSEGNNNEKRSTIRYFNKARKEIPELEQYYNMKY